MYFFVCLNVNFKKKKKILVCLFLHDLSLIKLSPREPLL